MSNSPESRGLVQVYTGDGKGKTTAALGLAIRACGQGKRVGFIQFLKNEPCGEHFFVSRHHAFEMIQMASASCFTGSPEKLKQETGEILKVAEEKLESGKYDILILDEIFVAVFRGFIGTEDVVRVITRKPPALELVLTGRYAPDEVIALADLVTEMRLIKHPFSSGIGARRGIEY